MLTKYGHRIEGARLLRQQQTAAEETLWRILRGRQFRRYKFRRQFPIGPFFADFCCIEKKLVIEVDGKHHGTATDADNNRTYYMMEQGFRVMRFWNEEVINELGRVCLRIFIEIKSAGTPLPVGEGGARSESEGVG